MNSPMSSPQGAEEGHAPGFFPPGLAQTSRPCRHFNYTTSARRACLNPHLSSPAPAAIFLATSVDGCYTALVPDVIGEGAARLFLRALFQARRPPACRTAFFKEKTIPWH